MPSDRTKPPESGPLRILHVVSGDLWAGAESQFFQLVGALNVRPEVSVRAVVMNPGILVDRLEARGVQVDQFDERRESALMLARRLCRIARECRPAIIHTHRRKEHIIGGLAALASGACAVATIHGRRESDHSWWKVRPALLSGLERIILGRVHSRIVAVSDELAGHLARHNEVVVVIPNGIDVEFIRRTGIGHQLELPGRPGGRLAFIGRLEPVKRVDRVVRMLEALHASEPGRWSLFIIGEGSTREAIEVQVKSCRLEEHVHLMGFNPDPLPWLAQMDALVFASEHEGLPMTALEALALGVPIVSPAIGGLTNLVLEAERGCIAASAEPRAIAEAVRIAVVRNDACNGLRSPAVPVRYTIDPSVDAHIDLYRKIAGGRPSR